MIDTIGLPKNLSVVWERDGLGASLPGGVSGAEQNVHPQGRGEGGQGGGAQPSRVPFITLDWGGVCRLYGPVKRSSVRKIFEALEISNNCPVLIVELDQLGLVQLLGGGRQIVQAHVE
jgi:hypothetical protein